MANLTNTFASLIKQGVEAMNAISDPEKKALAAAELAKAVAATGLVGLTDTSDAKDVAETKQAIKEDKPGKTAKKEEPKEAAAPKAPKAPPAPKAEPDPQPEPVEEAPPATEEVDETEWTEEAAEKFAEELEFIRALKESYGDEGQQILDECVENWSEGVYKTTDDITPVNVVGFKAYLEMLLAAAEE